MCNCNESKTTQKIANKDTAGKARTPLEGNSSNNSKLSHVLRMPGVKDTAFRARVCSTASSTTANQAKECQTLQADRGQVGKKCCFICCCCNDDAVSNLAADDAAVYLAANDAVVHLATVDAATVKAIQWRP